MKRQSSDFKPAPRAGWGSGTPPQIYYHEICYHMLYFRRTHESFAVLKLALARSVRELWPLEDFITHYLPLLPEFRTEDFRIGKRFQFSEN